MIIYRRAIVVVFAGFAFFLFANMGCQEPVDPSTDRDQDLPKDFTSCVADLRDLYEKFIEAYSARKTREADGLVHDVAERLAILNQLASKEGMNQEDLAAVESSNDQLIDDFMKLHVFYHNAGQDEETPDFTSELESIDREIENLERLVAGDPPNS